MRRRSSSRCSRKLIPVISWEPRFWAVSRTGLGISARGLSWRRWLVRWQRIWRHHQFGLWCGDLVRAPAAYDSGGRCERRLPGLLRRENFRRLCLFLGALLQFNIHDLGFELVL